MAMERSRMNSTKAPSRPGRQARIVPSATPVVGTPVVVAPVVVASKRARRGATTTIADPIGDTLTAGFKRAVDDAIRQALGAGLAVPGRENGKPVERRPDGQIIEIENLVGWSPDAWKSRV
jgi:hypothetical protein